MNIYQQSLPYVYKVTCLCTKQFYIGFRSKHTRHGRPIGQDIWIKYFTSSKSIHELLKIHGKDNFIIDILYADHDYHSVFVKEQELIKENLHDNMCLNQQYQDTSTGKIFLSHGYKHSEETKKKIQASQVGKHTNRTPWNKGRNLTTEEKSKQNISGLDKGRAWNKGIKTGIAPANKGKPSPHKGTKNLKNTGRFWTNNGETEMLSFDILPGFSYGRLYKRKPK